MDRGDGRYVSDFPDDLVWDHKNAVILPHLGASTEEAEDAAVSLTLHAPFGSRLFLVLGRFSQTHAFFFVL